MKMMKGLSLSSLKVDLRVRGEVYNGDKFLWPQNLINGNTETLNYFQFNQA